MKHLNKLICKIFGHHYIKDIPPLNITLYSQQSYYICNRCVINGHPMYAIIIPTESAQFIIKDLKKL